MSQFKLPAIEGILYYLHRQGHTPQAAYTELLSITGEETMTQTDVVDFFGMITHGTFGIKKIDEESKLHLTQQVDEVYDKIVENLDLTGRLSLLTTSKKLREVSQSTKFHINTLTIKFSQNYFQMLTDNGYKTTILLADYSENTNLNLDWDLSIPPFRDRVRSEFKKLFEFKAVSIDTMNLMMENIGLRTVSRKMREDVMGIIHGFISKDRIQVKNLKSNCSMGIVWNECIRHFEGLKTVKFVKNARLSASESRIELTGQIMNVERFTSAQFMDSIDTALQLAHIPYCKVYLETSPTVETLIALKEKLLLNPKLQQFKIRSKPSREVYNKLNEHFKTYIMPGANIPINQIFNYPGSRTEKLTFYATDQFFWFKGPCYTDNGEPDEEPEGVDDGFGRDRNDETDSDSDESINFGDANEEQDLMEALNYLDRLVSDNEASGPELVFGVREFESSDDSEGSEDVRPVENPEVRSSEDEED